MLRADAARTPPLARYCFDAATLPPILFDLPCCHAADAAMRRVDAASARCRRRYAMMLAACAMPFDAFRHCFCRYASQTVIRDILPQPDVFAAADTTTAKMMPPMPATLIFRDG